MARCNGEGTYYTEKDGKAKTYCWKIRIGAKTIVRKRSTKKELAVSVTEVLEDLRGKGRLVQPGAELTVSQSLSLWLEDVVKVRRDHSTYSAYESHVRLRIAPVIGSVKAGAVKACHVQKVVDQAKGAGASDWTVLSCVAVLCAGLGVSRKGLKEDGLILPQLPEGRDRVLSLDEIEAFLEEALSLKGGKPKYRDGFLFAFLINTGLRVNEALGLVVPAVNIVDKEVRVVTQLERDGGAYRLADTTKSGRSRTVPLNDEAMAAVRSQIAMIREESSKGAYDDQGLLFPTSKGTPADYKNVLRTLKRILAAAGLDDATVHDLRRSWETHLASVEPKVAYIAAMAGHSIATAQKHYILAEKTVMRETANKIGFARRSA